MHAPPENTLHACTKGSSTFYLCFSYRGHVQLCVVFFLIFKFFFLTLSIVSPQMKAFLEVSFIYLNPRLVNFPSNLHMLLLCQHLLLLH